MDCTAYSKPAMNFVNLRNEEAVAAQPCMSSAAHGENTFYYDVAGDGWLQILTGTNCNGVATEFIYIDNPEKEGVATPEAIAAATEEARQKLLSEKQAFSGEYVPTTPDPEWS